MIYQIFLPPQAKRSVIITNKCGIYELSHELPNKGHFRRWAGYCAQTRKKIEDPKKLGEILTISKLH